MQSSMATAWAGRYFSEARCELKRWAQQVGKITYVDK